MAKVIQSFLVISMFLACLFGSLLSMNNNDLALIKIIEKPNNEYDSIQTIALTKDGKYLIATALHKLLLFDPETQKLLDWRSFGDKKQCICEIIMGEDYFITRTYENSIDIYAINPLTKTIFRIKTYDSYYQSYYSNYDETWLKSFSYQEYSYCVTHENNPYIPKNIDEKSYCLGSGLSILDQDAELYKLFYVGENDENKIINFFDKSSNRDIKKIKHFDGSSLSPESFIKNLLWSNKEEVPDSPLYAQMTKDRHYVVIGFSKFGSDIKIFNTTSSKCIKTVKKPHLYGCDGISISDNGHYIVSFSLTGEVKIWEFETGACLKSIYFDGSISAIALSQNTLAIAVNGTHVYMYTFPFDTSPSHYIKKKLFDFDQNYDLNLNYH